MRERWLMLSRTTRDMIVAGTWGAAWVLVCWAGYAVAY
ncbi:hypothetical protein SEA_ZIPP_6 [Gordonia phage Zipp]|uniref:Uncharacterized protein n=1 Tax=Gordonia phage Zipp TaxID=2591212 RepID=A0A514DHR7_9CAUD|nr:hypothetical protein J1775_gp06 [Gordonia phage Zipp]QDH93160.1 hypothetical protein SEA_ZIPP_6 [Gordonia phage Zipp]